MRWLYYIFLHYFNSWMSWFPLLLIYYQINYKSFFLLLYIINSICFCRHFLTQVHLCDNQRDEDQDNKDERWGPDSDMEVDDDRYPPVFYILFQIICFLRLLKIVLYFTGALFRVRWREKMLNRSGKNKYGPASPLWFSI